MARLAEELHLEPFSLSNFLADRDALNWPVIALLEIKLGIRAA
ncbi:MAG: hypothetical protein WDN69_25005 [Aliidongia sp.]